MKKETWLQKNQVFLSGLAGALVLALQQFIGQETIDYKALGLAVLIAVGTYFGNQFRGRGVTIAGIVGIVGLAIASEATTGKIDFVQFGLSVIVGFLAIVAAPAKPITYERSAEIVKAKEIPPVEQVDDDSKLPMGAIH